MNRTTNMEEATSNSDPQLLNCTPNINARVYFFLELQKMVELKNWLTTIEK